jgi:tRNA nucleotidyltransferase/poly(A) polymerase
MLGAVADILRRRGSEGWLVGGNVRDRRLGRYSPDLDIVVADDPVAVAGAIATSLGAPWFVLSERHPAYRVVSARGHVDVAAVRGDGILADLSRRDFTINAMAAPVLGGSPGAHALDVGVIIDPFGGLVHLEERRLVAVSEGIFADDPLRLMRAARFSHVLGFRLDDSLADMVQEEAPRLVNAAAERVVAEMVLTLEDGRSADAVRLWHDLGLLAVVLPERLEAEGLAWTLAVLEGVDDLVARPEVWFPDAGGPLRDRLTQPVDGSVSRPAALRLAVLTRPLEPAAARSVAQRLKLSREMVSLLCTISENLAKGDELLPAGSRERDAVRALWESAPWEPETIALGAALAQAAAAAAPGGVGRAAPRSAVVPDPVTLAPARRLMSLWARRAAQGVPRPPVDGLVLMRELGIRSGPGLGKVLREIRLGWESGEIATADQALATARQILGRG